MTGKGCRMFGGGVRLKDTIVGIGVDSETLKSLHGFQNDFSSLGRYFDVTASERLDLGQLG